MSGALTARIGKLGFSDHHTEIDKTTPTGVYSFGDTMFGIQSNPGVAYAYHGLVVDDWWDENPLSPTYNTFVHGANPGGNSEALWTITPAYRYFAVIEYNMDPTVSGAGSGIFLHVSGTGPTAGCVSLAESDLLRGLVARPRPAPADRAESRLGAEPLLKLGRVVVLGFDQHQPVAGVIADDRLDAVRPRRRAPAGM